MSKLQKFISEASQSAFKLWLLNVAIARAVPFNRPHRFRIEEIRPGYAKVRLPYRRVNLNHVKGIHACALSTLSEFTSGLAMLGKISSDEYRIILKRLDTEYHYQAKQDVIASFEMSDQMLQDKIIGPLSSGDSVFADISVNVHDAAGNHISTSVMLWQVKKWEKVKSS